MQGSGGACQLEELHKIHVREIDIAVLRVCRDSLHMIVPSSLRAAPVPKRIRTSESSDIEERLFFLTLHGFSLGHPKADKAPLIFPVGLLQESELVT